MLLNLFLTQYSVVNINDVCHVSFCMILLLQDTYYSFKSLIINLFRDIWAPSLNKKVEINKL